jgi:hypothetical protein
MKPQHHTQGEKAMIQRRIILLFLAVLLTLPTLPTAAQTPEASFPPDA